MAITVDQLKQHMPGLVGSAEDADLTTMLAQAEALVAGGCGWVRTDAGKLTFADSTYTVQIEGPAAIDKGKLYLPVAWVGSITSVTIATDWIWSSGTVLVEGTDFIVDQREHCLRLMPNSAYSEWPEGRAVRVVFSGGWSTYEPEVVAVIAWMARHLWTQRTGEGVQSRNFDGQSVSTREPEAVPRKVRRMAAAAGLVVWGHRAS